MRYIRRLVMALLLVVLLAVGFVLGQRNTEVVSLDLVVVSIPAMPVGLLMLLAILCGVILGVLVMWVKGIRQRLHIHRLRHTIHKMELAQTNLPSAIAIEGS